ncbi:nucleotidyltransferase family protein [Oceanispirochaeta crateris]|nr:nucleotidyltransferase family protein [Oceanispirochaeta crateris]
MESEKSNEEMLFTKKNKIEAACIIPAGGISSRMGQWKAELPDKEGIPLLLKTVLTATKACHRVIVIGGYRFTALKDLLHSCQDIEILENKNYHKGMLSTIQTGLSIIEEDFFILPLDMPLIGVSHFHRITAHHVAGKISRPIYSGIPGHPVYIDQSWKERILKMKGETLGRSLDMKDQNLIPWTDESVIFDLDSYKVYESYLNH